MRTLVILSLVLICVGCKSSGEAGKPSGSGNEQATTPINKKAVMIEGSGGAVGIGNGIAHSKVAFPPPMGAEVLEQSTFFADLGTEGWGWGAGEGSGFEAAYEDGFVIALVHSKLDGPPSPTAIADTKALLGEPQAEAESENCAVLVWESGPHARFLVVYKREVPFIGVGEVTVIGPKERLKALGYVFDDPASFVRQVDASVAAQKHL